MKTDQYIQHLYQKFLSGKIRPEELQELFDCLENEPEQEQLRQLIGKTIASEPENEADPQLEALAYDVRQRLRDQLQPEPKGTIWWLKYAAAAIAVIGIGLAFFLWKERNQSIDIYSPNYTNTTAIEPGRDKAILTLSNGKRIALEGNNAAHYSEQGITIKQEQDGTIAYQLSGTGKHTTGLNKIEVPKGGQYKVILPDGTKVWLNSASTLSYPAAFGSVSRTMEMTGEAFFDIAPNKNFPFKVKARGQEVTALGTSFNINAYGNEPAVTTTLIEGRLKVQNNESNKTEIINPGQQTTTKGGSLTVTKVNASDVMAWKEGLFVNNNASLEAVMRQIERWYDVTVDVKIPAGAGTFSGELPRNTPITELLQSLELATGIKLKIEGRRITNR